MEQTLWRQLPDSFQILMKVTPCYSRLKLLISFELRDLSKFVGWGCHIGNYLLRDDIIRFYVLDCALKIVLDRIHCGCEGSP